MSFSSTISGSGSSPTSSTGSYLYSTAAMSTLRAAAILTNAYVGSTAVDCSNANQAFFLVSFTKGSLTSMSVKVQYSDDNSTWFDEPWSDSGNETISADEAQIPLRSRVHVFDTTSTKALPAPTKTRWVRLAVQGNGTLTSSSCTILGVAGVV